MNRATLSLPDQISQKIEPTIIIKWYNKEIHQFSNEVNYKVFVAGLFHNEILPADVIGSQ